MYKARGSMDLDKFTDVMKDLLSRAWGENWGTFTLDEPTGTDSEKKALPLPVITFDSEERTRSASHRSLDPIHYETFRDPTDPRSVVKLYRMWFDVKVVFNIIHDTNREARILMEEFEDFLFTFKGFFKEYGISDMIFEKETKPQVVTKWQNKLSQRTICYLVRIERITTIRSNTLNGIGEDVFPSLDVTTENPAPEQIIPSGNSLIEAYQNQFRTND